MRYIIITIVFFVTLVFNFFIVQQIDFVLRWNIIKKLRADKIEARLDKLENQRKEYDKSKIH